MPHSPCRAIRPPTTGGSIFVPPPCWILAFHQFSTGSSSCHLKEQRSCRRQSTHCSRSAAVILSLYRQVRGGLGAGPQRFSSSPCPLSVHPLSHRHDIHTVRCFCLFW